MKLAQFHIGRPICTHKNNFLKMRREFNKNEREWKNNSQKKTFPSQNGFVFAKASCCFNFHQFFSSLETKLVTIWRMCVGVSVYVRACVYTMFTIVGRIIRNCLRVWTLVKMVCQSLCVCVCFFYLSLKYWTILWLTDQLKFNFTSLREKKLYGKIIRSVSFQTHIFGMVWLCFVRIVVCLFDVFFP